MHPDPESRQQILRQLLRLRRRAIAVEALAALLWATALLLVLGAAVVLAEAVFYLPPYWRLLPPLLALAVAIGCGAALLCRGLRGRLGWHCLALYVERCVPCLRQRLITALELEDSRHCSPQLLAATTRQAWQLLQATPAAQILPLSRWFPAAAAAATVLLVTTSLALWQSAALRDVTHRWRAPGVAFSPPQRTHVRLVLGATPVIAGDDVSIRLRVDGALPPTATLRRRLQGETDWLQEELLVETDSAGSGSARYRWRDVRQPFELQALAGDGASGIERVDVIDPPAVTGMRLELDYPPYSGLPRRVEEEGGDLRALAGTRVRFVAAVSKRLRSAQLVIDDSVRVPAQVVDRSARVDWSLPAAAGFDSTRKRHHYHFELLDTRGIANRDPIRYTIDLLEDAAPQVEISVPGRDSDLPENQQVLLGVEARDDFGVARIDLVYQINDGQRQRRALPLQAGRQVSLSHVWDLAPHDLLPEDRVRYHVEAIDNDAVSGPKGAASREFTLRFPSLYELFDEVADEQEQGLETLEELADQETATRAIVEQLRRQVLKREDLDWQEKRELEATLAAEAQRARAVEELARQLAQTMDRLEESGLGSEQMLAKMEQIRELLAAVTSPEMQAALQALQQATQDPIDPRQLAEALRQFAADQRSFQQRLDRTISLLRQVHAEQQLMAAVLKAADLAQRQEQITAAVGEDLDTPRRQRLHEQETRLAADADRLRQELDELGEQMDDLHPPTAQGLKAQARHMEEGALSERMRQMSRQLEAGMSPQARRQGKGLNEDLGRLSQAMQQLQGEFTAGQRQDLSRVLRQIMADVIDLSMRQEALRRQIDTLGTPAVRQRASRQFALGAALRRTVETLAAVSRRTMSVHPGLPATLGYALQQIDAAAGHLGQQERRQALDLQGRAMTRLNEAARMLRESISNVASSQMPSGFAEAMERMMGLSQQQAALNEATQQMMQQQGQQAGRQGRGQGTGEQQLARLAAEQRRIYQALAELERSLRGQRSMQGRVQEIQRQMEDVLQRMEHRRADGSLVQRQQQILQRMLDASRSIHARGFEKKRRSQVATQRDYDGPAWLPGDLGQHPDSWRRWMTTAMSDEYPAGYRALVQRYYESVYGDLAAGGELDLGDRSTP